MRSKHGSELRSAAGRLAEWFKCWRLHLDLGGDEVSAVEFPQGTGPETPKPPTLEIGDVRLLKPVVAATARRAWFVAVLDGAGEDAWYVAPFSALPLAAFEGELELRGNRPPYLRTLCAWNTRRITDCVLARQSWPCGRLAAADLRAARAVWNAWRVAAPLPQSLRHRVGVPLVHPRDPRRTYEAEEASAFDETIASLEESSARAMEAGGSSYWIPDAERLLAAESEEERRPPDRRRRP